MNTNAFLQDARILAKTRLDENYGPRKCVSSNYFVPAKMEGERLNFPLYTVEHRKAIGDLKGAYNGTWCGRPQRDLFFVINTASQYSTRHCVKRGSSTIIIRSFDLYLQQLV